MTKANEQKTHQEERDEYWKGLGIIGMLGLIICIVLLLAGCMPNDSADRQQRERVEAQLQQAERAVPPPRVTNFTQLRDATTIIEMADQAITTWAYYMDMHGKLHFICEAKGYGLPYSTQTTNPDKIWYRGSGAGGSVPQAEPSGLYMPDNVAATWILCVDQKGGDFKPVYWEPDLVVSPFELKSSSDLAE